MPDVPQPRAPSVGLAGGGLPSLNVQATPAAFGGQIGAAEQQTGAQIGAGGQALGQQAVAMAGLNNETMSRNASVDLTQQLADAYSKFGAMQGVNAVAAYGDYQNQVKTLTQNAIDSMPNPEAKAMLGNVATRYVNSYIRAGGDHNAQQVFKASVDSSKSRAIEQVNQAVLFRNDPVKVNSFVNSGVDELANQGEIMGWSPDTLKLQQDQYRGHAYQQVISSLAQDNPVAAQSLLDQAKGGMDAGSVVRTQEMLKPQLEKAQTDADFNKVTNQSPGAIPLTINPDVVWNAVKMQESGGRQFNADGSTVTSGAGAVGVSQILPSTAQEVAKQIGVPFDQNRLATDAGYNEALGKAYFQQQSAKYQNPTLALAAYNAGPGAVDNALKGGGSLADVLARLPTETQNYVKNITTHVGVSLGNAPAAANDRPAMIQNALAMTAGDPDRQLRLMSRLRASFSVQDMGVAQERDALSRNLSNLGPALESGQDMPIPEADIHRLLPPDEAAAKIADLRLAGYAGQAFKAVAMASPADLAATQQDLAREGAGSGADFRVQAQVAQRFGALVQQRDAALKKDPASYAMRDPGVLAAYQAQQAANGDPAAFQAYAAKSLATQAQLGVPDADQRILSAAGAQAIAQHIMTTDPAKADGGMDIGTQLTSLEKQFGDTLWPKVFNQLAANGLPREFLTAAAMDTPAQAVPRADFIRAVQFAGQKGGVEKMRALVDPQAAKDIDQGVLGAMAEFTRTAAVPGAMNNTAMLSTVQASIKQLAYYYSIRGDSGPVALQKATNGIINDKYDFEGTMRVPRGLLPQVETATARAESAITPDNIADAKGYPGVPAGVDRATMAGAPKTWVTNETDDGLVMMARLRNGLVLPMVAKDGKRIELKFSDIAREDPPAPQDYGAPGAGTPVFGDPRANPMP